MIIQNNRKKRIKLQHQVEAFLFDYEQPLWRDDVLPIILSYIKPSELLIFRLCSKLLGSILKNVYLYEETSFLLYFMWFRPIKIRLSSKYFSRNVRKIYEENKCYCGSLRYLTIGKNSAVNGLSMLAKNAKRFRDLHLELRITKEDFCKNKTEFNYICQQLDKFLNERNKNWSFSLTLKLECFDKSFFCGKTLFKVLHGKSLRSFELVMNEKAIENGFIDDNKFFESFSLEFISTMRIENLYFGYVIKTGWYSIALISTYYDFKKMLFQELSKNPYAKKIGIEIHSGIIPYFIKYFRPGDNFKKLKVLCFWDEMLPYYTLEPLDLKSFFHGMNNMESLEFEKIIALNFFEEYIVDFMKREKNVFVKVRFLVPKELVLFKCILGKILKYKKEFKKRLVIKIETIIQENESSSIIKYCTEKLLEK